ncbi:MAG: flavodoxin family protein [Candidatus Paceibacterota bacterium]|jgi:flavodoxin|nr:flavodoxin family protein [Candidatus Paceibacterota bacterium]MDD4467128.1 flavodoxin family protein [Candidatus Paceibacterota bacterium]MDD4897685.1 flavodoxin family protein [Candidatus Paceibacterota bacterium]
MSKIKIVYGTCGGNTELVCLKVAEILSKKHDVELKKAKLIEPEKIGQYDLLILASPTYGHGQLEEYFRIFLKKLTGENLKGKNTAAIGLGDLKYDNDYHLESGKIIMDFFKKKETNIICSPLLVSKSPLPFLDKHVSDWAEKLSNLI